jgi:DNA-directed RNA polymerase specialized sigma24 family protein
LRDSKRRRERLQQFTIEEIVPHTDAAADARPTLRRILAALPEELAEIAVYYHVDELDQAEIAALLGVSRRTIGYRLERFEEEARKIVGPPAAAAPGVADPGAGWGRKAQGE